MEGVPVWRTGGKYSHGVTLALVTGQSALVGVATLTVGVSEGSGPSALVQLAGGNSLVMSLEVVGLDQYWL